MSHLDPSTPAFQEGQVITQDRLNYVVGGLEQSQRTYAENSQRQPPPPPGRIVGDAGHNSPPLIEHFVGRIRTTVPSDAGVTSDFTDCRYFVDFAVPYETLKLGDKFADRVETMPGIAGWVVATNLSELPAPDSTDVRGAGTHSLAAGTLVHVFAFRTRNTTTQPSVPQWIFASGGGGGTFPVGEFAGMAIITLDGVDLFAFDVFVPLLPG